MNAAETSDRAAWRRLRRHMAAAALVLFGYPALASAQGDELKHAAGAYLYVMDIVSILQQSRCAHAAPAEGLADALADIGQHMHAEDVGALQAFLQGEEFREVHAANEKLVAGWFESLAAYNYPEQTQCEMVGASVANVRDVAREQWERAKRSRAP